MPRSVASRPRRTWQPSPQQELLLRAALDENRAAALAAWEAWSGDADPDTIDWGSRRLLPLVHRNIGADQDPETWLENQLLFHETAEIIEAFRKAGIEVLVLKGVALAVLTYRDAALRPMTDVDLLVRPRDAVRAIRLLEDAGWRAPYARRPANVVPYARAVELRDERGMSCDLHWRLLRQGRQDLEDDDFWRDAIPFNLAGVPTWTLSPADQLLLVCVHGAEWNEMPSIRWVADATMLVRDGVDWDRLIEQARKRRLLLPMSQTLEYLHRFVPVPSEVRDVMSRSRGTVTERFLHYAWTGAHSNLRSILLVAYWFQCWRRAPERGFFVRAGVFLQHLQSLWQVDHLWQTPFRLLFKCLQVLARILTRRAPARRTADWS